ncbi:MAG: hypothetical protein ACOYYU_12350 [Chloroflexota bacterium]
MPTPESLACLNIDRQLTVCGWTVQSRAEVNLYASRGVAVREFLLETGEADYLLFVDRKAVVSERLGIEKARLGIRKANLETEKAKLGIQNANLEIEESRLPEAERRLSVIGQAMLRSAFEGRL